MKGKCKCSFCEDELVQDCMEPSFCQPCDVVFVRCKTCGESFSDRLAACPKCTTEISTSRNG